MCYCYQKWQIWQHLLISASSLPHFSLFLSASSLWPSFSQSKAQNLSQSDVANLRLRRGWHEVNFSYDLSKPIRESSLPLLGLFLSASFDPVPLRLTWGRGREEAEIMWSESQRNWIKWSREEEAEISQMCRKSLTPCWKQISCSIDSHQVP